MRLTPIVGFGVTIVALISLAAHPASAQTISNAGFEAPLYGSGALAYAYNPANAGWTFSGAGISGNGSAFTAGNPNAPAGNQVAFLQ